MTTMKIMAHKTRHVADLPTETIEGCQVPVLTTGQFRQSPKPYLEDISSTGSFVLLTQYSDPAAYIVDTNLWKGICATEDQQDMAPVSSEEHGTRRVLNDFIGFARSAREGVPVTVRPSYRKVAGDWSVTFVSVDWGNEALRRGLLPGT